MRYVIYGAGAIGGTIGARLDRSGREVVLIARGAHLAAIQRDGLRLVTPDEDIRVRLPAVDNPADAGLGAGDVVILAMKSQDTEAAATELSALVRPDVAIVCAQNGVENERTAARRGLDVYGMHVIMPATHLEPGVIQLHSSPVSGILDVGRYPYGVDGRSKQIAADLSDSTFDSREDPRIMRWKYTKLLGNLSNALEAARERHSGKTGLYARARAEAEACYAAEGIDYASTPEYEQRRVNLPPLRSAGSFERTGSSSWQSLARGTGRVEADWLNGEIVLLGRRHGIPTPVNEALRRLANRMAREHLAPGSIPTDEIEAAVRDLES